MSNLHEIGVEYGGSPKTLKSYLLGFVLCAILTLLSFKLVESHVFSTAHLYIFLAVLALLQLVVQAVCFLRLNNTTEGQWNLLPFLFVILIMCILVGGTLWIMYNLNYNMTL